MTDRGPQPESPVPAGGGAWSSRDRRAAVLLFLVIWVVYLLTATYDGVQLNDNRATSASAWSLASRGTLALPDDWEGHNRWFERGVDGALYSNRFPGTIATTVPFYLVADAFGLTPQPGHADFLNFAPAGVAAATIAALAMLALFAVFRELADRRLAVAATLVAAFATASWSITADAVWTHGVTSLGLALGMWFLARQRYAATGAAMGLAILARPQTAVVPAVVGLWAAWRARALRPAVLVGITSASGLALMSLYSRMVFGTWLPVAGYSESRITAVAAAPVGSLLESLANTLAHRQRGVLLYTPFLLVLLPFVWRGWRIAEPWVRSSAVAGVVYLVVQLRANSWQSGAHFFGSRLTIELLVLAAPLLLRTYQAAFVGERLLRRVFVGAVALSVAIHGFGAVRSISPEGREAWEASVRRICEDAPEIDGCDSIAREP